MDIHFPLADASSANALVAKKAINKTISEYFFIDHSLRFSRLTELLIDSQSIRFGLDTGPTN